MARYSSAELRDATEKFPRLELIHRPTPFRKLARLTAELGGPEIYVKREDLTGLGFGGNKGRKLEFIVRDMVEKRADTVITWASLQSNWCLQTAAAARTVGIKPILVLFKTYDLPPGYDGNLLLDYILGADIRIQEAQQGKVVKPEQVLAMLDAIARDVKRGGGRPYVVSVGGSRVLGDMDRPLGAISYVNAFREARDQAAEAGFEPDYVVHSTGSGGTQAGLVIGAKALTDRCRVIGISVSDPQGPFAEEVLAIARAADEALGLQLGVEASDIIVLDKYIRDGYGIVDREVAETIRLVFTREGIVLDPVYTAKAMAGLVDLIRTGYFKPTDKVVFFHTGGTPALFPNREKIVELLK